MNDIEEEGRPAENEQGFSPPWGEDFRAGKTEENDEVNPERQSEKCGTGRIFGHFERDQPKKKPAYFSLNFSFL
jgi:hypothetical protein